MTTSPFPFAAAAAAIAAAVLSAAAAAPQSDPVRTHTLQRELCSNVLVPQGRSLHVDPSAPQVTLSAVRADIAIDGPVATTTLTFTASNAGSALGEAELLVPVPAGAAITGFDFEGDADGATATVLAKDDAIATYRSIVARIQDPALLEFAGHGVVRSSVFPVPAGETLDVRLTYTNLLEAEGERLDYLLPRSAAHGGHIPWSVRAEVKASAPIVEVYSPTHPLMTVDATRTSRTVTVAGTPDGRIQGGDLRISVLATDDALANTLFTTADPDGDGGWFLFLAAGGERAADAPAPPPREVTVVIDRSGSMSGPKFDQAIEAARQVVEGLDFGEAVQIVDYSNEVARFAPAPVVKSKETIAELRAYLSSLESGGGTNLDGALQTALAQEPREGFLPVVLFLTDGLPTEGETREHVIRERAEAANAHGRRVFTFGVGHDVNAPLLDAVANLSRGRATYVRPEENVESAIGSVFANLAGPLVTDLAFEALDAGGQPTTRAFRDVHPRRLPDLFEGDRVLILGRYLGGVDAATIRVAGTRGGDRIRWTATCDLTHESTEHDFVRRLWAMRQVAALEDDLRTRGADPAMLASLKDDPRFRETIAEILDVATKHGVLSDSTAFLAREGSIAGGAEAILATACSANLDNNGVRSGSHGVAQQLNIQTNRSQAWVTSNALLDAGGNAIAASGVQQTGCRAYFAGANGWVDGRLALREGALEPDRTVVLGTPEHEALLDALQREGRLREVCLPGAMALEVGGEVVLVTPERPEGETGADAPYGEGVGADGASDPPEASAAPADVDGTRRW